MVGWVRIFAAGCCLAMISVLSACSALPAEVPSASASTVALPRPDLPWNEDFAAQTELEQLEVGGRTLLLPEGIRLPDDAAITAATEATVVMADDDKVRVIEIVSASAEAAGYKEWIARNDCSVWIGKGMAVRLEAHDDAQILAWGPESMKYNFAPAS